MIDLVLAVLFAVVAMFAIGFLVGYLATRFFGVYFRD